MTKIVAFAGRARCGKDSSLKTMYGEVMKHNKIVKQYNVDDNGDLWVNAMFDDGEQMAMLDIGQDNENFYYFASEMIWPFVKDYHFADNLKRIASGLYGIKYEQMFGTKEQKNSETKYLWKDFINAIPKNNRPKPTPDGNVTGRQFLQYLGDILRSVNDNCFTESLLNQIVSEQYPLALIGDCRRVAEVEAIKALGGTVIYLTRNTENSNHNTETEFDNYDVKNFDYVIDNQNMSMQEKNKVVLGIMKELGLI